MCQTLKSGRQQRRATVSINSTKFAVYHHQTASLHLKSSYQHSIKCPSETSVQQRKKNKKIKERARHTERERKLHKFHKPREPCKPSTLPPSNHPTPPPLRPTRLLVTMTVGVKNTSQCNGFPSGLLECAAQLANH